MATPYFVADSATVTIMRSLASSSYGSYSLNLPDGIELEDVHDFDVPDNTLGYVAHVGHGRRVGGLARRFVRADVSVTAADPSDPDRVPDSDVDTVLREVADRVAGDFFLESDVSKAGLGPWRAFVDFTVGDRANTDVWGQVVTLPITRIDPTISEHDVEDVSVHLGGQLVSDEEARKAENLALHRAVVQDRRELAGVADVASRAQATANEAQASADAAAVSVVPFFAMVEQGMVPTAPATDPPPAGWSTEEPGWLEGHNLWRSELTTRGDGTISWSAPSRVRSWTLAGEARGLAEDAALTAVMVNSPQESVVPIRSDGWPFWATGGARTADVAPSGDPVYRGTFLSSSAPEAYFRLTDVVDFKLVWWMRADAPATVSFRLVDMEGVDRVQAVRMWSPDTGEWVNTTSVSAPAPDAWTEYSAVVRVTPGTTDVRLVAGGAVLLSDVRLGVFSIMQEEINAENAARLAALDEARTTNEVLSANLLALSEDLRKRPIPVLQTGGDPTYWSYPAAGTLTARGTWTGTVWIVARKTNSSNDVTYTVIDSVPKADGTRTYTYDQYTDPPQIMSLVTQAQQYQVTLTNFTPISPPLDVWHFDPLFKSHTATTSTPHTMRLSVSWSGAQSGQTYGIRVTAGGRVLGQKVENRIGPFFGTGTVTQTLQIPGVEVAAGESVRLEVLGRSSGGTTKFHSVSGTSMNIAWVE